MTAATMTVPTLALLVLLLVVYGYGWFLLTRRVMRAMHRWADRRFPRV